MKNQASLMSHKKRNSLDNNQLKQVPYPNFNIAPPSYTQMQNQKIRQISYSPFHGQTKLQSSTLNKPQTSHSSMGAPMNTTNQSQQQQQQMMILMQQMKGQPQSKLNSTGQNSTSNRGISLDQQLIDFLSQKHQVSESLNLKKGQLLGQSAQSGMIVFKNKKKSQPVNSATTQNVGLLMNKENQLLMLNNIFNQKRNSMNEADRRKQQQYYLQYQQLLQSSKNSTGGGQNGQGNQQSLDSDPKRIIRSANSSPVTYHQFGNASEYNSVGAGQDQQEEKKDALYVGHINNYMGASNTGRPATGGLIIQNSHSNTQKGKLNGIGSQNNATDAGLEVNQLQRPKTSNKIEANAFANGINSQAATTASTNKKSGRGQTAKSMGEDSLKRINKKISKSKPNSRPSSGNKKKQQQQNSQVILLSQSTQQVSSQLQQQQMQQQQHQIKNDPKFKIWNPSNQQSEMKESQNAQFIIDRSKQDQSNSQIINKEHSQRQDSITPSPHIPVTSKFQSAPTTPTKVINQRQSMKKGMSSESNSLIQSPNQSEILTPQFIERNVITKYAFATRVGFIPNNPNKINQDSFILNPNLNGCNFRHYFGVCDGHGQNGKEASHFIKLRLPQLVTKHVTEATSHTKDPQQIKLSPTDEEYNSIFMKSFQQCNEELDYTNFDVNLSGSTVCTVIFNGTKVYCANAGDSRAIKVALAPPETGSLNRKKPLLIATALNRDHKPELQDEAQRIYQFGGRIDSFRDYYNNGEPIGPQRVWLQKEEIPGLAMSRSFGDKVAHSVGVSAEPETKSFLLSTNDKFVVIASDGVWEFLSNEDVAAIIWPYYEQNAPEAAANALVKAAFKKWKQEEEVIDDITVVIIFLEVSMAYQSKLTNRKQN